MDRDGHPNGVPWKAKGGGGWRADPIAPPHPRWGGMMGVDGLILDLQTYTIQSNPFHPWDTGMDGLVAGCGMRQVGKPVEGGRRQRSLFKCR